MIYINNLSITNDKTKLNVNVETNIGSNITKILLWNENTFKDYSQAIDISFKLEQINNKEIFTLLNTDISIGEFSGIYFLEFTSNYEEEGCNTCANPVIGIAANLNNVKSYELNLILGMNVCKNCPNNYDEIMNVSLALRGITSALSIGYYEEAIFLYKKLKKMIGSKLDCGNCRYLRTPIRANVLTFSILNNTLLLT